MAGVNKVILIGNLGRDPEIRYSQQGVAVVNFPIATSEQWTDKNTGDKQEKQNGTGLWPLESRLKLWKNICPRAGRFTLKAGSRPEIMKRMARHTI